MLDFADCEMISQIRLSVKSFHNLRNHTQFKHHSRVQERVRVLGDRER